MMKKKMKKTVAIISAALVLGTFQIADLSTEASAGQLSAPVDKYPAAILSDIEGHWAADSIRGAVQAGYVDGYEDGTFRPDHDVSRAEFIKLVSVAIGEEVTPVDGDFWYRPYIVALKEDGILPDDFYETNINIPMVRSEMAMIAMRAVDKNAQGTMLEATEKGLIQGVGNGDLDAKGKTTRAQSVTIINRILDARKGKELEVDKPAVEVAQVQTTGNNLEEAFDLEENGLQPNVQLPITHVLNGDIKMTIEQIVSFDSDDTSSPFYYVIEGGHFGIKAPMDGRVIVAYKVKYDIGNTTRDYDLSVTDYFNMVGWGQGVSELSNGIIRRNETGTKEDWIFFGLKDADFQDIYDDHLDSVKYLVPDGQHYLFKK